jgi:hypothetical protein
LAAVVPAAVVPDEDNAPRKIIANNLGTLRTLSQRAHCYYVISQ